MNKILLIIEREYLSRVKKKSFLLLTFLTPLLFVGVFVGIIYLTKKSIDDTHATVYVIDQQGAVADQLENNRNITYSKSEKTLQEQITEIQGKKDNTNILIVPENFYETKRTELLSVGKPNMATQGEIKGHLRAIVQDYQYQEAGINPSTVKSLDASVSIQAKELTETGDTKDSDTRIAMWLGMALSVLIYMSLFLYGSQVMRGIIEEKSNRIVEVIISSVKPFELMMGKIVGIGFVGLTQFLLWIVLSFALITVASNLVTDKEELAATMAESRGMSQVEIQEQSDGFNLQLALDSINFPELIVCFLIFFLGGYLLYSALFAAIGSAVDNEADSGQFTMPITMPLLLAYIMSFGVLVNDPHGTIAVWLSMIPLTSPIAMLVRIPFGVPFWQIALSASLLVGGFVLTTWVAARIYRVGILMYGKKPSLKELAKWFNYKD